MGVPAVAAPPPGYTLIWSDEFNLEPGTQPDPATWGFVTGPSQVNKELETYVDDAEHTRIVADADATDGSALQIEATSDGHGGYKSGRIESRGKQTVQYGYIEARIKMPYGQGIWPAFWMMGDDIDEAGWPDCGEIDIMETKGKEPSINHGSLHGPGYSGRECMSAAFTLPHGQRLRDAYHTFGLLWSPNSISLFVDGIPYETRTPADTPDGQWPYNKPMFFIVNLAVGGTFSGNPDSTTVFPQDLRVDYIRQYQFTVTNPHGGVHAVPGIINGADFDDIPPPAAPTIAPRAPRHVDGPSIDAGDSLTYSVQVNATRPFDIKLRVQTTGALLHMLDEYGNNVTGKVTLPNTSDVWGTVSAAASLSAGRHVLRVVGDRGRFRLGDMSFTPASRLVSGGIYRIKNVGTGACLDSPFRRPARGAAVDQWHDRAVDRERWSLARVANGPYLLANRVSGKFLAADTAGGVPVLQPGAGANARWTLGPAAVDPAPGSPLTFFITAPDGNRLTSTPPTTTSVPPDGPVTSPIDGTPLKLSAPASDPAQQWQFVLTSLPWEP